MGRRGRKPQRTPHDDLIAEVRVTNVLLAASLRLHLSQGEIVRLLATQTQLTAKEIGDILGTSSATVAVTLGRQRKQQREEAERGQEDITEADLREAGDRPARQERVMVDGDGDDGGHRARGTGGDLRTEGTPDDEDHPRSEIAVPDPEEP